MSSPGVQANPSNFNSSQIPPSRSQLEPNNDLTLIFLEYRPEFTIALVRTPFLSPRYAQFRVPLNFNKLDLRDYLLNLYGVQVVSIRSYVEQQPITRISRDGRILGPWRRPQSLKRMTVELREPFVWPEAPEDLSPYVCRSLLPGYFAVSQNQRNAAQFHVCASANILFLNLDGRKNLGTRPNDTNTKCARRTARSRMLRRSRMRTCARHTRNRRRRCKKTVSSGAQPGRRWGWTLLAETLPRCIIRVLGVSQLGGSSFVSRPAFGLR